MTLRQRLKWQRLPVRAMRIDHPAREARVWLLFAIAYVLVAVVVGWVIRAWPHPFFGAASLTQDVTYIFVFKIVLLLTVPLWIARRLGYGVRDLTPRWRPSARAWTAIVIGYGLGVLLNPSYVPLIENVRDQFPSAEFAARAGVGLFLPFLMAGFPEEFVYRGFLQTRLEAVWGRRPAIVTTAVLFTAWHLPTRYFAAHGLEGQAGDLPSVIAGTGLPIFVVGLAIGLVWDRYRSFWPLVAFHTGVDTLPIVASMLHIAR